MWFKGVRQLFYIYKENFFCYLNILWHIQKTALCEIEKAPNIPIYAGIQHSLIGEWPLDAPIRASKTSHTSEKRCAYILTQKNNVNSSEANY